MIYLYQHSSNSRGEERLLRTSSDNWFIVNDGTIHPAIVMGLSGKLSELVELKHVLHDSIPVIKRFTGGGTVIVDDRTIFAALICNKVDVPRVQLYPRPIMSWTGKLYEEVFCGFGNFHLCENGVLLRGEVPNLKAASIQLCTHIARDWFYSEDKEHSNKVIVPGLSNCGQLW
ncbi:uncharacterized protein LOC109837132 isoform X2 [Asparagus officinalis]|uniref:uncharacterized protein LOC109837132 isoform X2 n=1 Tax=Asparagus officinalis TaxID=4686 RepID=UPI00098E8303|nr:uncharacterized protein LOC109837132 isoform X2 [Asparagus officinalis]